MEHKTGWSQGSDQRPKQEQPNWRKSRVLLGIVVLGVLLIVGTAVLASGGLVKEVSKTFPTHTFLVGAHPTLILQTINVDVHIQYGDAGRITVEAKGSASGLDIGSNLDLSSFMITSTQRGDTVTVNAQANATVVGASKGFDVTITVPQSTVIEGYHPQALLLTHAVQQDQSGNGRSHEHLRKAFSL